MVGCPARSWGRSYWPWSSSALHESVILGDGDASALETVRTLVAAGVDVTIPAVRDGRTALRHASERGYDEIARVLDRADRPVERPGRRILAAARDGDADGVAVALRHRARLEQRDSSGRTPLLLTVTGDHVEAAKVLLNLGADPTIPDRNGVTALEHARRSGYDEIARMLARSG